jgi:hypothetical protein
MPDHAPAEPPEDRVNRSNTGCVETIGLAILVFLLWSLWP